MDKGVQSLTKSSGVLAAGSKDRRHRRAANWSGSVYVPSKVSRQRMPRVARIVPGGVIFHDGYGVGAIEIIDSRRLTLWK